MRELSKIEKKCLQLNVLKSILDSIDYLMSDFSREVEYLEDKIGTSEVDEYDKKLYAEKLYKQSYLLEIETLLEKQI